MEIDFDRLRHYEGSDRSFEDGLFDVAPWFDQNMEGVFDLFRNYLDTIVNCKECCPEFVSKDDTVVHELNFKMLKSKIKVLFVGDYKRECSENAASCFVGENGILLDKMIKAMNLNESEYAKTLIVKCHPAGSGDDDINLMAQKCLNNIHLEILSLRPDVVVSLGAWATNCLLGKKEKLSSVHGSFISKSVVFDGLGKFEYKLVPVFHPEMLIINPGMKRTAWIDLQKVMKYVGCVA